jgi:penicillin-binding protein 2
MVIKYRFRLYLFTLTVLLGFGALAHRLWNLTIERHAEFVNKIPGTKELRARIPGTRGEIKDRNGVVLVTNKPSYEVRVNLKMLVNEYEHQLREENKKVKRDGVKKTLPTIEFYYTDKGVPRSRKETDIVTIVNDVVISSLNNLGLATPYRGEKLQVHYRATRGVVPWVYRSDLSFEDFCQFAEHRLGLPGVTVNVHPVRQYLYDSLACHVLGYVSMPDIQKVSEAEQKEWNFYVPDDFGVAGVEKSFDAELRGRPGMQVLLQDEKGHIVRELKEQYVEPRKGNDIWLSLDSRIQYITERALRESRPQIGRGAVVVIQPSTGDVLAMASVPSYNPNKFIPQIKSSDFDQYRDNLCNPLLNRAVRAYAPGSTYKVMISFAGILAGFSGDRWNCSGGVTYGNKYMHCWIGQKGGSHGTLALSDAIKQSCNCYFYQYGNHAGINNIEKVGKMFGMGQRTGIELQEEASGILPSPKWLLTNRPKDRWSSAKTANTSIGQGDVLATPLQMAGVAAAVGNGGIPYKPHILHKVMDGAELVREQKPDPRDDFASHGMTKDKLELVRKGMWKVVNEDGGTGKAARIPGVEVAGKTGTAEAWRPDGVKENHTLFISFAPYVNPKYAICIFLQNGKSGGGTCAPIARRILEQSLDLDKGYTLTPLALAEYKGHFNLIESVSFEGIPPITLKPEEEQDANVSTDDSPKQPERNSEILTPRAVPITAIKEEADAQGSRAVNNQQQPPRRPATFQAPPSSSDMNSRKSR